MNPSEKPKIVVLRLGHRLVRDDRVTTHVCLVARAFGADKVYVVGGDRDVKAKVDDATRRWGGDFEVELVDGWRALIKGWKAAGGLIVHLTMYGLALDDVVDQVRGSEKDLLIVVGGEKVPGEVFSISDYNVAVGSQPHSEVSALAVFLDRYFGGEELKRKFNSYRVRVIPQKKGKKLEVIDE